MAVLPDLALSSTESVPPSKSWGKRKMGYLPLNKSGASFLGSVSLCLLFMEVKKQECGVFLIVFAFR